MREGWEIKTLGEVCDISAGQGAPQGEDNYCLDGTPFIKAGNLEALVNGEREQSVQKVSKEVALSHRLVLQKKGSIVFAKSGMSCMKGYVYTLQQDCYVVSHLAILFPKSVSGQYLNYALHFFKPSSLAKDASFPSITLKDLAIFPIPFPTSLQEQLRIVDILDREFAKIDALKANAEKSLQAAKDLFQATLKKELEPKGGWSVAEIGSVCLKTDNIKWRDIPEDKEYTYIDLTSVDRSTKSVVEPQRIKKSNAPSRAQRIVCEDDIIFATTRPTLRRYCTITEQYDGQICSTGFCVLRPDKKKVRPSWLFHCLSTDAFYDYVEPLQTGATYPAITDKDVKGYTISLPTITEQDDIVSRLNDLNDKSNTLQDNYQKTLALCDDLKQALLRKAFNGEL